MDDISSYINKDSSKYTSKLVILWLINKDTFINKMSRVRFNSMEKLSEITKVLYWGLGWDYYDNNLTVNENINSLMNRLNISIDFVICYKPLELKEFNFLKIPKGMRYNEMWDEKWTLEELNSSRPDLVICHHNNDKVRYETGLYKNIQYDMYFYHNPHCAEKTIFYDKKQNRPIDILLTGTVGRHYPFRQRLADILNKFPKKYNVAIHKHPGYLLGKAYTNVYLKEFADAINKAKICVTCTSKYLYRLGKMVEIPMCGSVLACDIPDQDQEIFKDIMIALDRDATDKQIIDTLVYYLENPNELEKKKKKGYEWSMKYTQETYAKILLEQIQITINKKNNYKLYVQSENLTCIDNKWICDVLKDEFMQYAISHLNLTNNPNDADVIWLLAPWCKRKINLKLLQTKFIVTTLHHIDWDKYEDFRDYYTDIDNITNRYHAICPKSACDIMKVTKKEVVTTNFWINQDNYYNIDAKRTLKNIYKIPDGYFIVGSFQKDTEGKDDELPKLSKGPDIFVKIVEDLKERGKNPFVILTGWRRTYVIKNLENMDIPYCYHETVDLVTINELYNCLDLYIVSSRVEGGPRAIIECGIAKIPIISTNVGIAELILSSESIFDMNNYLSYREAQPNVHYAYKKSYEYAINNYIEIFCQRVFPELTKGIDIDFERTKDKRNKIIQQIEPSNLLVKELKIKTIKVDNINKINNSGTNINDIKNKIICESDINKKIITLEKNKEICIIFVQKHNNMLIEDTIDSFYNYCIGASSYDAYCIYEKEVNRKKDNVIYQCIGDGDYNLFKYVKLMDYKYIVYIDNGYIVKDKYDFITDNVKNMELDNAVNQIILLDNNGALYNLNNIYYKIKNINDYDYNSDDYIKYMLRRELASENNTNINMKHDMIRYINNDYETYYFELKPSIIKTLHIAGLKYFPLINKTYHERVVSKIFYKNGLKSINANYNLYLNKSYDGEQSRIDYDNVTLITGYIDFDNQNSYIEQSKQTLLLHQNMIIFIEKKYIDHVIKIRSSIDMMHKTKIIEITYEMLYLYDKKHLVEKCIQKNKGLKNNLLYTLLSYSTIYFMKQCVDNNYFKTDYMSWIDFGLSRDVKFNSIKIGYNRNNKIRIGWISRTNTTKTDLKWNHELLASGLFIGHKNAINDLYYIVDEYINILMAKGYLPHMDKLLYMLYIQYPELFDVYCTGYDFAMPKLMIY